VGGGHGWTSDWVERKHGRFRQGMESVLRQWTVLNLAVAER
jgi:hypothetical protein